MHKPIMPFFLLAAFTAISALAQPGNPNPGVIPPSPGSDYGGLSAKWWKWALETPAPINPLTDETGANCAAEQSGPVFFLAGYFNVTTTPIQRVCSVPAGKRLFFPVANAFWSAEGTFEEMQQKAIGAVKDMQEMRVVIDGSPVKNIEQYYALSPDFTLNLPDDNIFGAPGGAYEPSAAAGYYLLLTPLRPGTHNVEIYARFQNGDEIHVIYTLHIQAGNSANKVPLKLRP
ncbi:MAG: hypothetical protein JNN08_10280 [Bryobacterales bacterium]|nr:hypothetical protein [Bryobacterales bacterium]